MLEVRDAVVEYKGGFRAVNGVSLSVNAGEVVALVGESGCGKTTLARAILGMQPLTSGEIWLDGERIRREDLARKVGMVWQDPYASLDPRWTIGRSLGEPGRIHGDSVDVPNLMERVGLDPTLHDRLPRQLSGGQRQRVAIGRALALHPALVLLDEPTAALDLSIQAQILNLLRDLQEVEKAAMLYISHDLATVRYIAQRVCVMRQGIIVEAGPTESVFASPQHEYTKTLLAAAPDLERFLAVP
ncbi:MAG: ABC transporter ATP-binding protein [Chthonomonas sp.]|nr:ABC transporter ATP-binding protein [Chthonomonas sp.]